MVLDSLARNGILSDSFDASVDESTRGERHDARAALGNGPKTTLRFGGNVELLVYSAADGALLERQVVKNKIVKAGRNVFRDLALTPFGASAITPTYIALGTDGTPVDDSDSGLSGEVFRKLITRRITADSGFTLQLFVATTEANGTGTQLLKKAAVFVYAAGAPVVAAAVFATITKTSAVEVIVNWQFTITSS